MSSASAAQDHGRPVFYGFLIIGILAMLGGIAMFAFVVPRDMNPDGVPRDAAVIFTEVFTNQLSFFQANKRYAASLGEVEVDRDTCGRYNCRLTTEPDGQHYIFRLAKGAQTWAIQTGKPVPKLIP